VPYERANLPQAWAAASPILAAQLFLGLLPDVAQGRCYLQPWLPAWLPELALHGIQLGGGRLDVKLVRGSSGTRLEYARHPELEVVEQSPAAPLWGMPMT
jgi:hypothetical protein